MRKCLKITFSAVIPEGFLQSIQKQARRLSIEGIAQLVAVEKQIRIIACGVKENVDEFLDVVHKEVHRIGIEELDVEPFIHDKDYRGVFRIIE